MCLTLVSSGIHVLQEGLLHDLRVRKEEDHTLTAALGHARHDVLQVLLELVGAIGPCLVKHVYI